MAFKCPVPGYEDSEKEFQTEAVLISSSAYWLSHLFSLTFYNEETRVLFYDKQLLAYICGSDKAIAKWVDWRATLLGVNNNGTETKLHRRNMNLFNMYMGG